MRFRDRVDAGRQLASAVRDAVLGSDVVVLGLPRGGVPVAFEVAQALGTPLDIIAVRKLGVPFQPELAAGAIGEDGIRVENEEVRRLSALDQADIDGLEDRERPELERRARLYRGARPWVDVTGRCVVVVDDGVATGSTASCLPGGPRPRCCARRARRSGGLAGGRRGHWVTYATRSCVSPRQSRSGLWGSGTRTSLRPRMRRSFAC